jgi:hypothetical protein
VIFLPIQGVHPVLEQLLLPAIILHPVKEEVDPPEQMCVFRPDSKAKGCRESKRQDLML